MRVGKCLLPADHDGPHSAPRATGGTGVEEVRWEGLAEKPDGSRRLALECSRLNTAEEKWLAEVGIATDLDTHSDY